MRSPRRLSNTANFPDYVTPFLIAEKAWDEILKSSDGCSPGTGENYRKQTTGCFNVPAQVGPPMIYV
jgi:hypothetical protein